MKSQPYDYLKYWRVIRQYAKVKYELNQADLDMLLFLYSEKYFDTSRFQEFNELLSWDKSRFGSLKRRGWIEVFRKRMGTRRAIYQLSYKSMRVINTLYKKLNGEEIPVSSTQNPMFKKNVPYTDKVYRNMIKDMNAFIKQEQYRVPEE